MSSNADNPTSAPNTITNITNSSTSANNVSNTNTNANTTINTGSDWNEQTIRLLINQRKNRNREYYQILGRSRKQYWESISRRINREADTNFTGSQCRRKFNNLVFYYYVSTYENMYYFYILNNIS